MAAKIPNVQLTILIFSIAAPPFRFAIVPCFVTGDSSFLRLVLMPAWTFVHAATLRFVFVCFIRAWLRITTTMTTVSAVTEQVHRDEEDENQNPEPICQ